MKNIANFFTLLNLLLGCMAIIFMLQTGESVMNYSGGEWKVFFPERLQWGAFCILLAAAIDFLDGFIARILNAESELGKQLDSLSDVVSFGVAPGILMYQLLRIAYAYEPTGLDTPLYLLLPALLLPLAAAWRLARFNISRANLSEFIGVPAPAAGIFIASLPLVIWYNYFGLQHFIINKWVLYGIILITSFLMVSKLPMLSFKIVNRSIQSNWKKLLLLVVGLVGFFVFQWLTIPIIFLLYIILSLLPENKRA